MKTPSDRGETTSLMEPLLLGESSRWRPAIHDKALALVAASTRLDTSLPRGVAHGLAQLIRSMNLSLRSTIYVMQQQLTSKI